MVRKTNIFIGTLIFILLASACAPAATEAPAVEQNIPATDLSGIKTYLLGKSSELTKSSQALKDASDTYYELAKASGFDYAALAESNSGEVSEALTSAKNAWLAASPLYEQMEGIVAGTPSLAEYDVILDAGTSGEEDPEGAVPFDLTLPDGRVLAKPGNLFGVLESTLWGTYADFTSGVEVDLDSNGSIDFGEKLPDANVLKSAADALHSYSTELGASAQVWVPTESDAFTSLVVMVPTMSEYFNSWKNSRFILGDASEQRDFVVISRLADIQNILGSLQVVYGEVKPLVEAENAAQAAQIETSLEDLKQFVADVYDKEQGGYQHTPEEADVLGAEAQNRATAIAGQVAQIAAKLNISIEE
ncbi:MAG: EfeM/EfeO family lipoprotein [Anaerolineales bacterium]|nr:EfeM/EfeO family lipoprotein [Anaerolineales bacterium]